MKPVVLAAGACLILLVGLSIGWQVKPTPKPIYRDVIVPDTVILQSAPDTVLRFVDRIKWRVAEPQVIARGTTSDLSRLDNYCATIRFPSDSVVPPAALPPTSGRYTGKVLDLYATDSRGRLFHQSTPVSSPFEWVATDSTYEVREQRAGFRFFRGIPKVALPFLAGVAAGVIVAK